MRKRIVFIVLLINLISAAHAHDPGFSRSLVVLDGSTVEVALEFARQDLEVLVRMDADLDGEVSREEFLAARHHLQSIATAAVDLSTAGRSYPPALVEVNMSPGEVVDVELYYDNLDPSDIKLRVPLLVELARGHRQQLSVQDKNGNLLYQHIRDAGSPAVSLRDVEPGQVNVFGQYLAEGIWHIWIGFDHVLFLLTLLLPVVLVYDKPQWQPRVQMRPAFVDTLKVVTAFTLAHSITLALAVLNIVTLPTRLVESAIAISVLMAAVNNLKPFFPASRGLLAFTFGLVHGFGFAGVLVGLGLPADALKVSLLGFNLGVEVGQLAIVLMVLPLATLARHTIFYRRWVFGGGSATAAVIATVWMLERMLGYELYRL